jgi:hypothetical protein
MDGNSAQAIAAGVLSLLAYAALMYYAIQEARRRRGKIEKPPAPFEDRPTYPPVPTEPGFLCVQIREKR